MNIYVASSWRNVRQPAVVQVLLDEGYTVYDFRNPPCGDHGFTWTKISSEWQQWAPAEFVKALDHPAAEHGFASDMEALQAADVVVLVLPCGRSAHLEAGWAAGAGKAVVVLLDDDSEPELMYKMAGHLALDVDEMVGAVEMVSRDRSWHDGLS